MSFCADQISGLAASIYSDLGSPSSLSVAFISGWIASSGTLGDINNKLGTSFYLSGDAPCIAGCFDGPEANILSYIYKSNYYEKLSLTVLAGGGTFWTNISEGDTKISRSNLRDISKAYLELNQQSNTFLRLAISDWKRNHTDVQMVDSAPLYAWPPV